LFAFFTFGLRSQTLFTENFDSYANIAPLPTTGTTWKTVVVTSTGAFWQIKNACTPPSTTKCLSMNDNLGTDCDYNWGDNGNEIAYYGTLINAVGYNAVKLNFKWKAAGETCSGSGCDYGMVVWSLDGTTWNDVSATKYMGQTAWQTVTNLNLSAADNQQFYIGFRWINDGSTGAAPAFTVDDISITATALTPCSGTPLAGTSTISSTSGAAGVNYTLSNTGSTSGVTGISYQWQSSSDGSTWNNIAGATSTSYVTSAAAYSYITYYRLIVTCSNSGQSSTSNTVTYTVNSWNQPSGTGNANLVACAGTIYDHAGTSDYSNSQNSTFTICPSTAGQFVRIAFTSWNLESNFDYLSIFDGNSTSSGMIVGSSFSATSPGTVTATTTNSSGCLTLKFFSDGATVRSGFQGTISCVSAGATPLTSPSAQDCNGAFTICSNENFNYQSNGVGNFNDANSGLGNRGCLNNYAATPNGSAEHQSVWGFFSPSASGTLGMTLDPAGSSSTDYDWAIWGPFSTISCPPTTLPIRCSAASASNSTGAMTGMGNGASDTEEGTGGNGWVSTMNVIAGQKYVIMVDNWNSTSAPLTLSWQLSGGASLSCIPLPIQLISFYGKAEGNSNSLEWITGSEANNDFFTIEKSSNAIDFYPLTIVNGAGNSNQSRTYTIKDTNPYKGLTYYRLIQTDYNGETTASVIISVNNDFVQNSINNIHPNPTTESVNFDFTSANSGMLNIQVIDYTGKIVVEDNVFINEGLTKLTGKMNSLKAGIYFLKVGFETTGFSSVTKIIKQ